MRQQDGTLITAISFLRVVRGSGAVGATAMRPMRVCSRLAASMAMPTAAIPSVSSLAEA